MSNERISFAYLIIISLFYCFNEFSLKKNIMYFFIFILLNILIYVINPNTFDRIIFHSINQLKNSNSLFVSSYRHDLHYFTAIQMFKEKPIFGHGLKSFRYKCDDPSYKVKEKIL